MNSLQNGGPDFTTWPVLAAEARKLGFDACGKYNMGVIHLLDASDSGELSHKGRSGIEPDRCKPVRGTFKGSSTMIFS